ncbi:hypothetical protein HID58_005430, partial [Brassica napus]
FREWDPGTGGAKGISDHYYGCLEANRKGFKGSDTTDTIEIRRDLGKNGKLGIEGFWYLLRASSRVCFFEDWSIVSQLRNLQRVILNQKEEVVGLEIKEKYYRSALLRLWKVLIVWQIHTYHDGVGLLREEICGINQIIWHLIGLDWWRGVEEIPLESVNVVGNEEDSDDGFNNLTDGDVGVEGNNDKIPEESHELDEEAIQPEVAEGKEQIPGEVDKKKVVRKSLFKSSAIAGGSTKARMVQALVATRKRTVSKTAPRHGEGAKQQEEKGPSNPKPNIQEVERVCEQLVCSIFNFQFVFQFNKLYEHMIWVFFGLMFGPICSLCFIGLPYEGLNWNRMRLFGFWFWCGGDCGSCVLTLTVFKKQTPCLQGGFYLEELLCLVPLNQAQISKVYMEAIVLVEIEQHESRMGIRLRRSNKYGG